MPNTAEHRVEMARLARDRRAADRPVWDREIDLRGVFHNDSITSEARYNTIAGRLEASTWLRRKPAEDDLHGLVRDLRTAPDAAGFNEVWDAIYDEADYDRVFIRTR
jgi:hypothetical protein